MKTPHAILIGLSLIAAAIYFKDTAVKPAYASGGPSGVAGFDCMGKTCYIVDNNQKLWKWWVNEWVEI